MIREFEGELSGVLMERICQQWAEWWQMTSSSFVSPLDCLTSFLGISLSRAVSSFGRITNVPKLAITAESYIRSWRKPPEMPEVCRMPFVVSLSSSYYYWGGGGETHGFSSVQENMHFFSFKIGYYWGRCPQPDYGGGGRPPPRFRRL